MLPGVLYKLRDYYFTRYALAVRRVVEEEGEERENVLSEVGDRGDDSAAQ